VAKHYQLLCSRSLLRQRKIYVGMNQNQAICILREGFVEDIEDIEIMIIICENLYFPFQRFCKIEEWLLR
jgi:hypothetical protein